MRKRGVKLTTLVLALVFALGLLAGCAKGGGGAAQVIRYNLGAEPKTLDPALNAAVEAGTIIENVFEGLMRLDEKDRPIPGVAERYEKSADGLKYTFYLRKNAKWSDGKPVTAKDFEYAWKRALDPNTAAEYAYQLYYLKNGEAYNTNKATADQVGVKALDDYTLEVTLEAPTPYFLSLMAFPTYMPVRKDIVEGNSNWATKPETYIGNGPFKMTQWLPKDKIVIEKNENYWDAKRVKLAKVEMRMLEDATAALSAFRSGQLDYIESPPSQEVPNMLKSGEAQALPYLGTYFYEINVSDKAASVNPAAAKVLKDARVRKALSLAIDRKALVDNVLKGGQTPATTFVADSVVVDEKGNRFKTKDYYKPEGDVAEAKRLLAEAGYPDGSGFPEITITYNTGTGHQNIAQAIQEMWRKNLNINVKLENQEWKVFQVTRTQKQYLIARGGWIADYNDPMTFLDMWMSNSGNNDVGYNNPEYDRLIAAAKKEADPAKRVSLLHQAEDLLMKDMPLIPLYYYNNIVAIKPYVKGVTKSQLGFVFFDTGYVQK
ncbi:peptide ABC transporter substrate-binding protein [Fonticella tunisiensis]|uniref:Oligopeptide transport system substrate-binding protein n=1 Tax=Fonticella tunisiensis TaxID=1096341 RepID=A0A4R7KQ69_9CLOT|nr:peptide ABC transporter substrate-binding protein [Fonticella tunisiensis]TDT58415.1 oligopeptide transport system substrate-binding protein [Fonticella tunisiensis]